jgi:hypothetical protein
MTLVQDAHVQMTHCGLSAGAQHSCLQKCPTSRRLPCAPQQGRSSLAIGITGSLASEIGSVLADVMGQKEKLTPEKSDYAV